MPNPLLVYSWLNRFEASHLSEATRFCVDQIKTELQKGAGSPPPRRSSVRADQSHA